jgi:hypothetical protein
MPKQICARCTTHTRTFVMSRFNTDLICIQCERTEREHPKYEEAYDTELQEVMRGNLNFEGIGLPTDFDEWVENFANETTIDMTPDYNYSVTTFGEFYVPTIKNSVRNS